MHMFNFVYVNFLHVLESCCYAHILILVHDANDDKRSILSSSKSTKSSTGKAPVVAKPVTNCNKQHTYVSVLEFMCFYNHTNISAQWC